MARPAVKGEHILQVAGDVFRELGYAAASMDEIARRAGVAKATLYRYYPAKQDLFAAVLEAARVRWPEQEPQELGDDPEVTLTRILLLGLERLFEPAYAGLVRVAAAEARHMPELAATFVQNVLQPIQAELHMALVHEQRAGKLRDVDVAVSTRQLIGLCVGYAMPSVLFEVSVPHDGPTLQRVARENARTFLYGVLKRT